MGKTLCNAGCRNLNSLGDLRKKIVKKSTPWGLIWDGGAGKMIDAQSGRAVPQAKAETVGIHQRRTGSSPRVASRDGLGLAHGAPI